MEQFYEGHRIEVSAYVDDNTWFTSSYIYYGEGSRNILVTFPINQEFKTYHEAMEVLRLRRNGLTREFPIPGH